MQNILDSRKDHIDISTIGVIGVGAVGSALFHALSRQIRCIPYDIKGDFQWDPILATDAVMICTDTPSQSGGRLNCSSVMNCLSRLESGGYRGIVVIRSTLKVGFMEEACDLFPMLCLVYMPEFLREKDSMIWAENPDRIVISGPPHAVSRILRLYSWAKCAKVLVMDHRSAEVAKLAHNAFIAAKISFTNEIEGICGVLGADANSVMATIWADKRVQCSDHLQPGLGPYGGKCVPKDTLELVRAGGNPVLLSSVIAVNDSIKAPSPISESSRVSVIIPTIGRKEHLRRSIRSALIQTTKPERILIVRDPHSPGLEEILESVVEANPNVRLEIIENSRASNISGAINTGLSHIEDENQPKDKFIAILDDDDWWDPRYIENCLRCSNQYGKGWVISGIIRHEESFQDDFFMPIPNNLSVDDFLVSNPGLQGSNLFVRHEYLSKIGGFDETLRSTTDRDIGIRLLTEFPLSYQILRNYLVHHDASERGDRCSTPGSEKKRQGLLRFYEKYHSIMTEEQKAAFRDRSAKLFMVEIP
jgi:UDPglucose 6-dehydrogenase